MSSWVPEKVKQIWSSMMGTCQDTTPTGDRKTIVVVGGGVGGSHIAYNLQSFADVVLIDQKEYFEIIWAGCRAKVDPSVAERSIINHSDYLNNVRIVTSKATDITDTEVITEDGDRIAYDYLVIATGHMDTLPRTRSEKLSHYQTDFENIKSSNSILIVGGGPTGVELAAEIFDYFPEKKVTLVHRGPRLLQFISAKAAQKAFDWLTSRKIEVILNQSVDSNPSPDGVYQTSGGESVKADSMFLCIGTPLSTSWLKDTILKDSLTTHERLMVDGDLRVRGHKNVFAIGDITSIQELKQGFLAQKHAQVAAKNIKLLLAGGNESKMATYKPGWPIAIVSLGRKEAVAQFGSLTISGRIPGMLKSGDLFVEKTRKERGIK